MALHVGVLFSAARATATNRSMSAMSRSCISPFSSSTCFSAATFHTSSRRALSAHRVPNTRSTMLYRLSHGSACQSGSQVSIRTLLLRSRAFSSTSLLSKPSSPPPTPPSPTPASPPTPSKQPLSEDILTIPNMLTISRLLITPYIGYLVSTHQFPLACSLLFVASLSDVLDGWLARRTGKYTVFGSIADPAADKALVTTMVISLAVSGMLPWTLATVILGRDVALVISAFVIRYRTLEPPKTMARYWNPRLPSATVTPTQISKYNTFLQLLLLGLLTLYPVLFPGQPGPGLDFTTKKKEGKEEKGLVDISDETKGYIDKALTGLMWIVGATTVWSGAGYLGGAGTGKVLAARAQKVREKISKTSPKL